VPADIFQFDEGPGPVHEGPPGSFLGPLPGFRGVEVIYQVVLVRVIVARAGVGFRHGVFLTRAAHDQLPREVTP
jgi:hypothetical protein